MKKTPYWFHAIAKGKTEPRYRFVYVRPSWKEGEVIIFNGQFYIKTMTREEVNAAYEIGRAVNFLYQDDVERDFQYYLNY